MPDFRQVYYALGDPREIPNILKIKVLANSIKKSLQNENWFWAKINTMGRSKRLSYVWKKYHKNEWHLCLVEHSFTKLSQNMWLINIHILIYWYARCDWKLWNFPCFIAFFWIFSYIIDDHYFLNCCMSKKSIKYMFWQQVSSSVEKKRFISLAFLSLQSR